MTEDLTLKTPAEAAGRVIEFPLSWRQRMEQLGASARTVEQCDAILEEEGITDDAEKSQWMDELVPREEQVAAHELTRLPGVLRQQIRGQADSSQS